MGKIMLCSGFLILILLPAFNAARIALLVVDVQRCFTKGGTLEMTDGKEVVEVINSIRSDYGSHFDLVVYTQDWHCPDDVSFASTHQGYKVRDKILLFYDAEG